MSRQAAEVTEPQQGTGRRFVRRNASILAPALLLAVLMVVTGVSWVGQHEGLERQQARIDALEGRLKTAQLKKSERANQDVLKATGASRSRLRSDASIIAGLVDAVFTWGSGEAYAQARTRLKRRYGLSERSKFLTRFMPPTHYNEDADGRRYYYIDTPGMNSAVSGDPEIEVVKVAAGDYTYAVLVDVEVTADSVKRNNANKGRYAADRTVLLFLTIDAQGEVSDLAGIPASGPTRHSG
ncbi:hypothetical protein [Streptomyces sp. NRRL F-5053]|uniref:hypothetical protein n=1 Tax=Streptomyces sp. NRRL F-5053 TaxID=1463854 RepID=UPI0004C85DF1|nr:hypothetical protein [Streptomyces sp. NRRL F-5053]